MKYLFVGSHCDEEICFAGAIQKFNNNCFYVAFSTCGHPNLKKEFDQSCDILDVNSVASTLTVRSFDRQSIADFLYKEQESFDCLVTHSVKDVHPDHRIVAEESIRVWKKSLITYLAPWNGQHEENYFIGLSAQQLSKKIEALSCYKSQVHRKYMDADFITSQAIYNGIKCGKRYAEAFRIEKLIN